ncbi:protein C1orf43 homolog isoform X2 [Styela clava]|uniref:protein C1orf43 homolog isoform X2 n=1 Tax=Styela clava TaxID=7725 RepID=UPI0019394F65|nr:protein C1orf43 homolog isoform X2 [Styela clava]
MLNVTTMPDSSLSQSQDDGTRTGVNILLVIMYGLLTLKEDINERLMQTLHVVHEPRLLSDGDERNLCMNLENKADDDDEIPYNYLYRMKALDDIKILERALCRTDESLKRHPLKNFKQHMRDIKSHSSGVMRTVRSSQIKALTDAYEHARYKPEPFGKQEYEKFRGVLDDIISGIEHKVKKKKTKKLQKNINNSSIEGPPAHKHEREQVETHSENEPLIDSNPNKKNQ